MDSIDTRINRVIGQLKGIQNMVKNDRDCGQIIQQITSIKKAIDGLAKELMVSDICKYVPEEQSQKVKEMVGQAIKM